MSIQVYEYTSIPVYQFTNYQCITCNPDYNVAAGLMLECEGSAEEQELPSKLPGPPSL